jgi:hypothetical protein
MTHTLQNRFTHRKRSCQFANGHSGLLKTTHASNIDCVAFPDDGVADSTFSLKKWMEVIELW